MNKLLQLKLKWLAKLILARYKPELIGVTGSAGKTSATEAIFAVLSSCKRVRRNEKNYNNEIG
ncbi:MAG TPA: UDP-N-acetylmuramoyl-tripeptide--D-alanyl-D-alanine ligase, partial [Candidatus Portnoybacteria bacterium]|nr:UDP-N-acetylmuramoyl-tripeptide--D-alanyl-D-alanine ligase [Candidatus Portnoybacteria bacterium]